MHLQYALNKNNKKTLKLLLQRMKPYGGLYLIALPGIFFLLIFRYLPMYGLIIAFKDFNVMKGILGSNFVGLKNFTDLFNTSQFPTALKNTILLSVYNLVWGFPVPIILAMLLNEVRLLAFKKTVQTITYIPHFFSWVVISGIFIDILSPSSGVINLALQKLGFNSVFFMANPNLIRSILVLSNIWKEAGWGTILYLAAISSIDDSLYEAAAIDGAGRLRQAFNITLPALKSTIIILLIMRLGDIMGDNFEQILMMSSASVQDKVDVIDTYIYRQSFLTLQFGLTSAAGLFKSVINCFLLVFSNRIVKMFGGSGMY
jgi:putative aldouronate transport system permease protein